MNLISMAQPDPVAKLPGDPSLPSSSEELQKLIEILMSN